MSKKNAEVIENELERLIDINQDTELLILRAQEFVDAESNLQELLDNSSEDWLDSPADLDVLELEGSVDAEGMAYHACVLLDNAISSALGLISGLMEKQGIKTARDIRMDKLDQRRKERAIRLGHSIEEIEENDNAFE